MRVFACVRACLVHACSCAPPFAGVCSTAHICGVANTSLILAHCQLCCCLVHCIPAGLTVCGDSCMPGIGVPAAAASGMMAANSLAPVWDHLGVLNELGV